MKGQIMLIRRTAVVLILFSALSQANLAAAQDVPPVVAAMLKSFEAAYQSKPTYKSINTDGTSVTIEGLEANMAPQGGPGTMKLSVAKVELEEVEEEDNGIIEVGSAIYTDTKIEIADPGMSFSVSVPESTVEDWYLKTLGDNPTAADKLRASMSIARKASTGPITITAAGQTVTADSYQTSWDGDPVTGTGKIDVKVANILIPESVLAMADPTGTLKNLGYTSLSFDVGGAGTMSNDGNQFGLDLDAYYAGKDIGTIKMGFAVAGVSMELIEALQKMEPNADPSALLPLAQSASFSRVVVRFEDSGITNKLIPLAAQMQGTDPQTMIANAGAMVQIGMSALNVPALTEQVVKAVSAYLADPKSITIAIKPASPLGIAQLMTINPADPAAAVTLLGVSVTAND
jgi:hypothetical protein